jgi:hypothetical protein
MRTSLNEISAIESYLHKTNDVQDSLLFEAKMLTQPELPIRVHLQQKIERLVKFFHRKKLKQDLQQMHNNLFADPEKKTFQQQILQHFKS